jgi:protease-4
MVLMLLCVLSVHPFYDGNFSSLSYRTTSIFTNPAGLGLEPGSELTIVYDYHKDDPDIFTPGIMVRYFGIGWCRMDSINNYETSVGYKLPGVFSLGYAFQFGDSTQHKAGIIGHPTQQLSLGYHTTIGDVFHMFGGISIRPFKDYITLSCDIEYEKTDSIMDYHYGAMIQPVDGIKAHFAANKEFAWRAGLELSFGQVKVAGAYSYEDKRISGGVILSARPYKTFIPDKKKALILNLDQAYPEIEQKTFFGIPIGSKAGFTRLLSDLRRIPRHRSVQVILVRIGDLALGQAQIEELRTTIQYLKTQNIHIVFYADHYWNLLVYDLACAGDELILPPMGSVNIPGLALRKFYLAGTLGKLGVEVDIASIGEYKSATEIFTRTDMSEHDREQLGKILDDMYYPIIEHIAHARQHTIAETETLIDSIGYFNSDDALKFNLVDTVLYEYDVQDYVKEQYGNMNTIDLKDLANIEPIGTPWRKNLPKIALVIAEGMIVPGEGSPGLFNSHMIGSAVYTRIFETLKDDRDIRAVIVRINSGGGDGFASEQIATAIARCAEEKPLVVSMGDVAGSGGYYIACLADRIYADQRTITGSIGVFSYHLATKGLYEKLGVTWDCEKRGEHSDMYLGLRRLSEEEYEKELTESQWWYDKFTARVASGRSMKQARVDSLGRGRVYSGIHAFEVGLIDEIGGFFDALEAVKEFAKITGDVEIVVYPSRTHFSLFGDMGTQSRYLYLMPEIEVR